jgi:hypothetical protein
MSQPISIGNYWKNNFFEGHIEIFYLHRAQCQKDAGRKKVQAYSTKRKERGMKNRTVRGLNFSQLG